MNWGARIVLSFIIFGMIMTTMVVIAMKQDINLVREDYYEEEIKYESQIERLRNAQALLNQPEIKLVERGSILELSFPEDINPESGSLLFFRPSNAGLDQKVQLKLNEQGKQLIQIKYPEKGYWKAQLTWKSDQKEYFKEQVIIL